MKRATIHYPQAALLLLAAANAFAADAPLVGDASTRATTPSANLGTAAQIDVSPGARGFLQFDLSALPAGTKSTNIGKAVLVLYVNKAVTPGTLLIGSAVAPWSEGTITDMTAPGAAALTSVSILASNQFVIADVTTIVQQWADTPASNHGFVLSTGSGAFVFDSKESLTTSQPARLGIDLAAVGPQGPKGDTGAPGPQGVQGPPGPNVLALGSASAPSLSFAGDSGTGIYSSGTGVLSVATGGQRRLSVGPTGSVDLTSDLTLGGIILARVAGSVGSLSTSFGVGNMANSTGGGNTALGAEALVSNTTGASNTAVGAQSMIAMTTGVSNSAIGALALRSASGSGNVALGAAAGLNLGVGNNNLYLANPGAASENGKIRIGSPGTHTATFVAGVTGVTTGAAATPVVVDANGQLGTNFSLAGLFTRVRSDYALGGNSAVNVGAACPANYPVLISGGCGHRDYNAAMINVAVHYSGPDINGGQFWTCLLENTTASSRSVVAYAICSK